MSVFILTVDKLKSQKIRVIGILEVFFFRFLSFVEIGLTW